MANARWPIALLLANFAGVANSPGVTAISFRSARADDLPRLVEIHALAFPDARGTEERRKNFLAKPFGPFADLHVAVEARAGGEDIVGHAFGFGLSAFVGGVSVPAMGIATVGVAPEARGRGVATALVRHLHEVARAEGMVASFLYPFRQEFYARTGYVTAPPVVHLALATTALAGLCDPTATVRRADTKDRPLLHELYVAHARRATGMVLRTERLWQMHFAHERRSFYVLERAGVPSGYVSFALEQAEAHGETRADLVDLVGLEAADRLALLGFLYGLRDQVAEIDLCLPSDDPLVAALGGRDLDRRRPGTRRVEHALGVLGTGPMLRLVSPRDALEARGYSHEGVFRIDVDGDAFGLVVTQGRARVVAESRGPLVAFTGRGLVAVAYAGYSIATAAALGWVRGEADALFAASRVLEVPVWDTWDRF